LLCLLGLATAVVGAIVTPGGSSAIVPGSDDDYGAATGAPSLEAAVTGDPDDLGGEEPSAVIVHVLGAVETPGIVEVRPGDRVVDAVAAAGGTTDDADLTGVNLARILLDGEQLRVPRVGEVSVPPADGAAANGGSAASESGAAPDVVNINTADTAALETLPGVGPALASSIIAWRDENGAFRAVDELLAVSGIGEKTLDGFRDQVTV